MSDKSNKFIPYNFNKHDRENILKQIKKRDDRLTIGDNSEQLIEDIRNSYTQLEIEYLLTSYEIQSKKYTDESIQKISTLCIAIVGLFISTTSIIKEKVYINLIFGFVIFILCVLILFILWRIFAPKGSRLNTAIFWLKQAKELDEPQKNEQTDKDDDE